MSAALAIPRVVVRLDPDGAHRAVFTTADGVVERMFALDAIEPVLSTARATHDELTFAGAEPTHFDALPALVRVARALGFTRVGVETDGRRLATLAYAHALGDAGLTDVRVSLHGASAPAHEYHTGESGSFAQTVAGVAAVRARGITVVASTVLTRSNYRVLAEMPRWLQSRGIAAWVVSVPPVVGRTASAFDRLVPRLAMSMSFVLHAIETARTVDLAAAVEGAPACLLGPLAHRALPSPPRAYAAVCTTCAAQPFCPGVDPVYLARFHGDELAARSNLARPSGLPAHLARMFVGLDIASLPPVASENAPATGTPRRILPMAPG